jgi:ribonuclease G
MEQLQEELQRDRNHARAVEISDFGLVEMTRKRTGPSLDRLLTTPCPHCEGSGRRLSAETAVLSVYREMARLGPRLKGATVQVTLHPEMKSALQPETKEGILHLAKAFGAKLQWIERTEAPLQTIGMEILRKHEEKA